MSATLLNWCRQPQEFARKLVLHAPWTGSSEIFVDHGTQVLVFLDGVCTTTLPPGRYAVTRFVNRKTAVLTLVWLDSAVLQETLIFKNIRTCDNIPLDITMQLSLRLEQPALFCFNILKERESYYTHELKAYLFDEVRDSIAAFIMTQPIAAITPSRTFKDMLEAQAAAHLSHSLRHDGIYLVQIRSLHLYNPDVEALKDFQAAHEIISQQQKIKLQEKKDDMEGEHALRQLSLEQEHQLAARRMEQEKLLSQTKRDMTLDEIRHQNLVDKEMLVAKLSRESLAVAANEDIQDKKLQGGMARQKYKVGMEAEIARIALETQQKRSEVALSIQQKLAELEFEKAERRIRIESLRNSIAGKKQ